MFKRRDVKILYIVFLIIGLIGTFITLFFSEKAALIFIFATVIYLGIFTIYLAKRNREIKNLNEALYKITLGNYNIDLNDHYEGELSVLKSQILKSTITYRELNAKLQSEKEFLARWIDDISHQLKTPITSMGIMVELLYNDKISQDKKYEFLGNISSSLDRLNWLVSTLLKIAKIDNKGVVFKREEVSANKFLREVIDSFKIALQLKDLEVRLQGEDDIIFLIDIHWAKEALSNIIKNAVEHSNQGGIIEFNYGENPLYKYMSIKDHGQGMSIVDQKNIFKRFYCGQSSKRDSVGIGLSLSKIIIENLDGEVEVKSEIGMGSEFIIKFRR